MIETTKSLNKASFSEIIFDLDGTLWDTCRACANAWNSVINELGIEFRKITLEDIRSVTGRPHDECIRRVFQGISEINLKVIAEKTATEDIRFVKEQGGDIYPGVSKGLQELFSKHSLFIVSNCQSGYIETFLNLTDSQRLFQDFECWGNSGLSKAENLRQIILRNKLINPVFIGDTEGDRIAAESVGIPFVFVEYGFGQVVKCDFKCKSFAEVVSLFN